MDEKNIEKESAPINENKLEETTINNQPNIEQPKSSKLSTVLLILLFVFMFIYIMEMPYIDEFIKKINSKDELSQIEKDAIEEEKRQEQNNKPQASPQPERINKLTCTSSQNIIDNYTMIQIQIFNYNSKNEVINSSNILKYSFTLEDEIYKNLKTECEEDSMKYATYEGYTMNCNFDGLNVEIGHVFELDTFKSITNDTTNISANATYKQDVNAIKNNLLNQGYICE